MKKTWKFALLIALVSLFFNCEESERYKINYGDNTPPGKPIIHQNYKPLYGGARIYFTPPDDRDVLTIDANYTNQQGRVFWFSTSYFSDYIDVLGFADTNPKVITLYATDRAGNKSERQTITVVPKEPAVSRIVNTVGIKGGFGSFYVEWQNELKQVVNVYVNYSYKNSEKDVIYTSADSLERKFIVVEEIPETTPIKVKVNVEDSYGNISKIISDEIHLIKDEKIPKDKWIIPKTNDSIGGVPQGYWDGYEGRMAYLTDDIVDDGFLHNFGNTASRGRTGKLEDGDLPANVIINLGEEWEISRVITHQRDVLAVSHEPTGRGLFYGNENIGVYRIHIWNEADLTWDSVRTHKIIFPADLPGQQYRVMARKGDMAYLYPDEPRFSAPTKLFRYEALYGFLNEYTARGTLCLSEITLYGRRTNNINK